MVSYWDWVADGGNGRGKQEVVYRVWLEFADLAKASVLATSPKEAFDPRLDYANPHSQARNDLQLVALPPPPDFGGVVEVDPTPPGAEQE